MMKIYICILSFTSVIHQSLSDNDWEIDYSNPAPTPFQDWDYLVYSQRWPVTVCTDWEQRNKNHTCNMPIDPNIWTVHGIWPTKIGKDGPFFCDSAIHFDMGQIEPIMNDLQLHWTNIEGNTKPNSFWKHEWDKHGTCASTLPQLNSVINFFNRGLFWNQKYKLTDILRKSQIVPNDKGYKVQDIFNSVKSVLGKNPTIECIVDSKTKDSLINEIRICFDKNLDLIDCNVTDSVDLWNDDREVLSNCNLKKPIMYFANVTSHTFEPPRTSIDGMEDFQETYAEKCLEDIRYEQSLITLYRTLRFLIWFTI